MSRVTLAIFMVCQAIGEICSWSAPHVTSWVGPWLWVISVVLLLPGDFLVTWIIEKLLWTGPLTVPELEWVKVPCEVAVNGVVWLAIACAGARLRSRKLPRR